MKRWMLGALVAFAGIGALSAAMVPLRTHLSPATPALVLVIPVVAGASVGGLASGVLAVAAGFVTYDALFLPPYGTLDVGAAQNWTALAVYAVVMLIVARIFAFLRRARLDARRDADTVRRLYELSDLLIGDQPVTRVLQVVARTLHQAFDPQWVAVLIPEAENGDRLAVAATAGEPPADELPALVPEGGRAERLQPREGAQGPGERVVRIALTARGRPVGLVAMAGASLDRHAFDLVRTYANQAALALEASQLREQAVRTELLEQVDALRASLISAVSHDLRTPLASVKTAVSALRRGDGQGSLSTGDREELLALIENRSDALDRLVANLLDMTRIQSGTLELRREITPVPEVIDGGLRASGVPPETVTVDVSSDVPPVDVDVVLMEQVLANLLDNAVRHSPDGTPVSVSAHARGDVVELSVTDRGPGVPMSERDRVFTMFSRLGTQGRAGLGLAIAKAFVEAHGQTIHVDDAPGGGARFVVTLPAAPVPVEM
ncbi:MAG: ATP-binding protein [Actinomycetota bacterium]|nr:ATP-binding protein [Actinomycetota bacterium]